MIAEADDLLMVSHQNTPGPKLEGWVLAADITMDGRASNFHWQKILFIAAKYTSIFAVLYTSSHYDSDTSPCYVSWKWPVVLVQSLQDGLREGCEIVYS